MADHQKRVVICHCGCEWSSDSPAEPQESLLEYSGRTLCGWTRDFEGIYSATSEARIPDLDGSPTAAGAGGGWFWRPVRNKRNELCELAGRASAVVYGSKFRWPATNFATVNRSPKLTLLVLSSTRVTRKSNSRFISRTVFWTLPESLPGCDYQNA